MQEHSKHGGDGGQAHHHANSTPEPAVRSCCADQSQHVPEADIATKDPVCGMAVNKQSQHFAEFDGKQYWFCSNHCREEFLRDAPRYAKGEAAAHPDHHHAPHVAEQSHWHTVKTAAVSSGAAATPASKQFVKDPICGMMVDKATALSSQRGGRSYYFCSESCLRTFESPESELKAMKTRVTIALTGVLALAILRAGAFIALAAGATLLTWVPIPALP